ncbi:MAG: YceI family protein [Deltaproteobacteria bacterium]|nr:MAG: YceI family protein [Deltaproteobacteria bacterium]
MKKLLFLLLLSTNLYGEPSKKLEVYVDLWPAGDFIATSTKIRGKVFKQGSKYTAKNIRIPVTSIETGIDLRNTHLQQRLKADKAPKTNILLVEATGENGKGTATFKVNDLTQTVPFTFKELSPKFIQATFTINFAKFKIPALKYMGVGVQDEAKVIIVLPLKEKK